MSSQGLIGRIGVELYADLARFTGDLGKAEKQTRDFVGDITSHFGKVQAAITGVAATVGVLGFAKLVDDVAKARAGLDDLADSGLGTVESLSRIKNSAKAFGADFEGLTASFSKMVNGLAGSEKETSKAGEALRRLGINARDSAGNLRAPAEIFEQLAVELNKYRDGADKAAFVQAILGKGAERFLPLLKDMAEYGSQAAKVSKEQAEEADRYEKAMRRLSMAMEGSLKKIAGEFIPVVTALAGAFTDLLNENNKSKKAIGDLAADGSLRSWAYDIGKALAIVVDVGIGVVRGIELIGKAIGQVIVDVAAFGKVVAGALMTLNPGTAQQGLALIREGWSGLRQMGAGFKDDLDEIASRAWFSDKFAAKWNANIEAMAQTAGKAGKSLDSSGLGDKDKAEKISAFAKAIQDAQTMLKTAYAESLDPLNKLTGAEKALISLRESPIWAKFTQEQRDYLNVLFGLAGDEQKHVERQKQSVKVLEDARKAQQSYTESMVKANDAISDELADAQKSIDTYGLSKSAVLDYSAALLEQQAAMESTETATKEQIALMWEKARLLRELAGKTRVIEALDEQRRATEMMTRAWDSLADAGGRFFSDLLMNGRSAFDRLKDSLKSFTAELIALFAKRWILNIAAGMTGSASLAASAATAGNGTAAGGLLNILGSAGGIGSAIGSFIGGGAGVAAPGMGLSAGVESFLLNTTGSVGLASAGGSLASGIAALGPYAAIAAAAYGLYKAFAPKRGGPKEGGGYGGNFDASSNAFSGAFNGWYAVDSHNGAVQQMVSSTAQSIAQLIASFGGTLSNFGLQFGYDSDPKGTAPNRLKALLTDANGGQIYGANYDFARGDAGPQLQLEMSRILVAALKNSNISADIKALFDSFDVASATQASIDELMAKAEDLNGVLQGLAQNTIGGITLEAVRAAQQAGETLGQTFARMVGEMQRVEAAVSSAIAGIWASAQAALGGQFASTLARTRLQSTYAQWQQMRGENFSFEEMLSHFQSFTPELLQQGIDATRAQYGASGVALLNQLWTDYAAYVQAMGQGAQQVSTAFTNVTSSVGDFGAALVSARTGLADYLRGSLTGQFSPLSPLAQLTAARDNYTRNLALAQGGNADAIGAFGGLRDEYLRIARSIYASSGAYNDIFFSTFNQGAGLTGGQVQPLTGATYQAGVAQITQSNQSTTQAVIALGTMIAADGIETRDPAVQTLLDNILTEMRKQSTGGVLA